MKNLPPWAANWATAQAEAHQVPVELTGALLLSVLSAALAKKIVVRRAGDDPEPVGLYAIVVSDSVESALLRSATQPLSEHERTQSSGDQAPPETRPVMRLLRAGDPCAGSEPRLEEVDNDVELELEECRLPSPGVRVGPTEEPKGEEQEPTGLSRRQRHRTLALGREKGQPRPRIFVDYVTPSLVTLLAANQGRLAVFSEDGDLEELCGRSPEKQMVLRKAWCGHDILIEGTRKGIFIRRPALTIWCTVHPDALREVAVKRNAKRRDWFDRLERFLYVVPTKNRGCRKVHPDPVPDTVTAEYMRKVRALLEAPVVRTPDGEIIPRELTFSEKAQLRLTKFKRDVESMLQRNGVLSEIQGWGERLVSQVARIAGLLWAARDRPDDVITGPVVGKAIAIVWHLIPHAVAAARIAGRDPVLERADRILRSVIAFGRGSVSRDEINKANRRYFAVLADMDKPLQMLVERGWLRRVEPLTEPVGARPSERFCVHPDAAKEYSSL